MKYIILILAFVVGCGSAQLVSSSIGFNIYEISSVRDSDGNKILSISLYDKKSNLSNSIYTYKYVKIIYPDIDICRYTVNFPQGSSIMGIDPDCDGHEIYLVSPVTKNYQGLSLADWEIAKTRINDMISFLDTRGHI